MLNPLGLSNQGLRIKDQRFRFKWVNGDELVGCKGIGIEVDLSLMGIKIGIRIDLSCIEWLKLNYYSIKLKLIIATLNDWNELLLNWIELKINYSCIEWLRLNYYLIKLN